MKRTFEASRSPLAVLAILACLSACGREPAPDEGGAEPCDDCVGFQATGQVRLSSAPTLPSVDGLLLAGPHGGYAFVDRSVRHEILVFDPDGRYRTTIGGLGDGPGEFDRIWTIAFDSADTLWVASRGGNRLDLFGPDLEFVRSLRTEVSVQTMVSASGGMVVAVADGLEGQVGMMDSEGRIDVLWRDSIPRGSGYPAGATDLATSADGTIWFAEQYAYRVWRVDPGKAPVQILGARPMWFEAEYPDEVMERFGGISDRGSTITDLMVDTHAGILWVTSAIPASDVTVGELEPLFDDPQASRDEIVAALLDYVVEAYDLASGARIGVGRGDSNVSYRSPVQYRLTDAQTLEILTPTIQVERASGVN